MEAVVDESTTQILTLIRDDVKSTASEVTQLGKRVAVLSQIAHDQQQDVRDLKTHVGQIAQDTTTCAARLGWPALTKRVSSVEELSKATDLRTPLNGVSLRLGLSGSTARKWLPWIILVALAGADGVAQLAGGQSILSMIFGGKP
jgi:hypothetical protein